MIPVTKPYLPSREKLDSYIDGIYERNWLTNNGPLVQELTYRLEEYLGVKNLLLVSNGTLALQIAYRALGINETVDGKPPQAITTPFTFVATSSSLKWEGINPVFVDINPDSWNLNPSNIEAAISELTRAIVPVHVFGNPCEVEEIQSIAERNNLKVIYDAAHAFGVKYKEESILKWGDAATLSFHATKVFHTIEGGAIIFKRKEDLEKAKLLINFGIAGQDSISELGVNAKMSEFNAAMGLSILNEFEVIQLQRKKVWKLYSKELENFKMQKWTFESVNNYSYMPILIKNETALVKLIKYLDGKSVKVRRYFYPCLSELNFLNTTNITPIAKDISERIMCIPIYPHLSIKSAEGIAKLILENGNELS